MRPMLRQLAAESTLVSLMEIICHQSLSITEALFCASDEGESVPIYWQDSCDTRTAESLGINERLAENHRITSESAWLYEIAGNLDHWLMEEAREHSLLIMYPRGSRTAGIEIVDHGLVVDEEGAKVLRTHIAFRWKVL